MGQVLQFPPIPQAKSGKSVAKSLANKAAIDKAFAPKENLPEALDAYSERTAKIRTSLETINQHLAELKAQQKAAATSQAMEDFVRNGQTTKPITNLPAPPPPVTAWQQFRLQLARFFGVK